MKTHVDKLVASILAIMAVTVMVLYTVAKGWSLDPPRLGVQSALLAPLGHIAMRSGFPDGIVLLLTCLPLIGLGTYISRGWIRGTLRHATLVSILLYGAAIVAAFLAGSHQR